MNKRQVHSKPFTLTPHKLTENHIIDKYSCLNSTLTNTIQCRVNRRHSLYTWLDPGSSHQEGNFYVKLKWHGLPLDKSELAQVVAVVAGVEDVRVVQLPKIL